MTAVTSGEPVRGRSHADDSGGVTQPTTFAGWRMAAIAAAGLRLIHDARLYGFIAGGPEIVVERVDEVLDQARAHGVVPTQLEAEQAALDIIAELAEEAAAA